MANKVKFGLRKCYYATFTENVSTGVVTYGTPVALPGAVSLTLDAEGDINPFYADNVVYYQTAANNGYTGELEIAMIPDDFRVAILGEVEKQNGLLAEYADATPNPFALGFQIEGDDTETLFWFYNVSVSRPSTEAATVEEQIEPATDTLNISIAPRSKDALVRVKTSESTGASVKNAWFSAVVEPTAASAQT